MPTLSNAFDVGEVSSGCLVGIIAVVVPRHSFCDLYGKGLGTSTFNIGIGALGISSLAVSLS